MDRLLATLAEYVTSPPSFSEEAYEMATWAFFDTIGCACLAATKEAPQKLLGQLYPNVILEQGVQVLGRPPFLDPMQAAFQFGLLIRWLDYNDTWLAKEWAHPSDNLATLLALMTEETTLQKLLEALICAYELQGSLAMSFSCHEQGFDHVYFVKIASSALAAKWLGLDQERICDVLSHAFLDGGVLRTYRHGASAGSRKSWAAADAASRAIFLAHLVAKGEMGYPNALTEPKWGVEEVLFKGQSLSLARPLGDYVIHHLLFKVLYPAEFHAQTAVEAAKILHPQFSLENTKKILITTTEATAKIIDKKGALNNPASRDHCLQYMVAVMLLQGSLSEEDYEDQRACDPQLEHIRNLIEVTVSSAMTHAYHKEGVHAVPNQLLIQCKDGTQLGPILVDYPLGHKRRRKEALPYLKEKGLKNIGALLGEEKAETFFTALFNKENRQKSCLHLLPWNASTSAS